MDLQIEAKRVNSKRVYVPLWEPINPLCEKSIRLSLLSTDLLLYSSTYVSVLQLCPYTWYTAMRKYESIVTRKLLNPNTHKHTLLFATASLAVWGKYSFASSWCLMIFNFRWNYENVDLTTDLIHGRGWRMCWVLTSFLRMWSWRGV